MSTHSGPPSRDRPHIIQRASVLDRALPPRRDYILLERTLDVNRAQFPQAQRPGPRAPPLRPHLARRFRVESIHVRNATALASVHPFQPIFRKRFFRLKHVVLEGNSAVRWTNGLSQLRLRAPNLETIRCDGGNWNTDLRNLAHEIGHANPAAAVGGSSKAAEGRDMACGTSITGTTRAPVADR